MSGDTVQRTPTWVHLAEKSYYDTDDGTIIVRGELDDFPKYSNEENPQFQDVLSFKETEVLSKSFYLLQNDRQGRKSNTANQKSTSSSDERSDQRKKSILFHLPIRKNKEDDEKAKVPENHASFLAHCFGLSNTANYPKSITVQGKAVRGLNLPSLVSNNQNQRLAKSVRLKDGKQANQKRERSVDEIIQCTPPSIMKKRGLSRNKVAKNKQNTRLCELTDDQPTPSKKTSTAKTNTGQHTKKKLKHRKSVSFNLDSEKSKQKRRKTARNQAMGQILAIPGTPDTPKTKETDKTSPTTLPSILVGQSPSGTTVNAKTGENTSSTQMSAAVLLENTFLKRELSKCKKVIEKLMEY